jgi:hypothetical protein
MAPPGFAGLVVRGGFEDFEGLEAVEVREGLEPLGGLELSGVLEQPESIRPNPARSPRPDRKRLRVIAELLFSAFTVSAW